MTKDTIQDFIDTLGYIPILEDGDHDTPLRGACVMEMVSFLDNDWTDTPSCTMKFISKTAQMVNDFLPDGSRHLILSQFDRLFGTSDLELPRYNTIFSEKIFPVVLKWAKIATDQGLNDIFTDLMEHDPKFWKKIVITDIKNFIEKGENGVMTERWDEDHALEFIERIMRHHHLTNQQYVDLLSDVLDVADDILGREEVVPVDKSRLKDLDSVRPTPFTKVRYESS